MFAQGIETTGATTFIKMGEEAEEGRATPTALVGLRIYLSTGQRSDDRGNYEGWEGIRPADI